MQWRWGRRGGGNAINKTYIWIKLFLIFNELCFLREERNKNGDEGDKYTSKIQKIFSRVPALRLNGNRAGLTQGKTED